MAYLNALNVTKNKMAGKNKKRRENADHLYPKWKDIFKQLE